MKRIKISNNEKNREDPNKTNMENQRTKKHRKLRTKIGHTKSHNSQAHISAAILYSTSQQAQHVAMACFCINLHVIRTCPMFLYFQVCFRTLLRSHNSSWTRTRFWYKTCSLGTRSIRLQCCSWFQEETASKQKAAESQEAKVQIPPKPAAKETPAKGAEHAAA